MRPFQPHGNCFAGSEACVQGNTEKASLNFAVFDQIGDDSRHHVNRDGEADSVTATRVTGDRRVDPNNLTSQVEQRTTTVPWIDRRIGLNEVLKTDALRPQFQIAPPHRTDNPVAYGMT